MIFELECDSCAFSRTVEMESRAYDGAKNHEKEHPEHFVFITTREPESQAL